MICDEDPLRRRPRESTARRKRQERCVWMARKMTEWPSKRGPITKIMPSDGCIGDTVPLAVGKWYDFHEFGWYMGNVGVEIGEGDETVYSYGYRCAPDRLKIGSCAGDVIARVAAQISTGTPDKPVLLLTIRTHDCRALERVLHGIFRLKKKRVIGAGAEWFLATRDEVIAAYESIPA